MAEPLKRRIGPGLLTAYGVGVMVGAGIYVLVGAVAGAAGIWAPVAFLLAGLVAAPTALSYSEFSTRLPEAAGEAAYVDAAFGRPWLTLAVGLGIVLSAVGSERAIAHPSDPAVLAEAASVVGGLALFLLGNGLFKWSTGRWFPLSHLIGLGLCAVLLVVGRYMSLLTANLAAAVILTLVAIQEHRSLRGEGMPP